MPTVLRREGFRLYFYSHEPNEPPHVHVDKSGRSAKFWLQPVGLARNLGFRPQEIGTIIRIVRGNREELLKAWHGHLGTKRG